MRHHVLRFEGRGQSLLSPRAFVVRLARNIGVATLLVGVSLVIGMAGYHYYETMPWIDAFANAAMILSGMGPLGELKTSGGKLFAGCYALYSGLVVVVAAGIILAPAMHRLLHHFHAQDDKKQ